MPSERKAKITVQKIITNTKIIAVSKMIIKSITFMIFSFLINDN